MNDFNFVFIGKFEKSGKQNWKNQLEFSDEKKDKDVLRKTKHAKRWSNVRCFIWRRGCLIEKKKKGDKRELKNNV